MGVSPAALWRRWCCGRAVWCRRVLLRRRRSSELLVFALDWLELEARRGARAPLLSVRSEVAVDLAADWTRSSTSSGGGFDGGCGKAVWLGQGALAPVVHRQQLRRGAADGLGSVFYREKFSLAAARWRLVVFVSDAGDVVVFGPCSVSSTYSVPVFLPCTLYVVFC